ncbi:MAG: hypothetical protein AB7V62_04080 [Thermoleophilia bacterium]
MTEPPTARPIARLATELRFTGLGQIAIGLGGVVAALIAADESAARLLVPFAIVVLLIGGLSIYNTAWLRRDAPAGEAAGARIETTSDTYRRSAVGLVLALVAVALVGAFGPSLAAILGGVVGAVGLVDLYNDRWVRAREKTTGEALYRELGRSPFSPGRRPLYTRPLKDSTLAM